MALEDTGCKVCFEMFNKTNHYPILGSCGHTCCMKCVRNLIGHSHYRCPICREGEAYFDFSKNYLATELLNIIKEQRVVVEFLQVEVKREKDRLKLAEDSYREYRSEIEKAIKKEKPKKNWLRHPLRGLASSVRIGRAKVEQLTRRMIQNVDAKREAQKAQLEAEIKCERAEMVLSLLSVRNEELEEIIEWNENNVSSMENSQAGEATDFDETEGNEWAETEDEVDDEVEVEVVDDTEEVSDAEAESEEEIAFESDPEDDDNTEYEQNDENRIEEGADDSEESSDEAAQEQEQVVLELTAELLRICQSMLQGSVQYRIRRLSSRQFDSLKTIESMLPVASHFTCTC